MADFSDGYVLGMFFGGGSDPRIFRTFEDFGNMLLIGDDKDEKEEKVTAYTYYGFRYSKSIRSVKKTTYPDGKGGTITRESVKVKTISKYVVTECFNAYGEKIFECKIDKQANILGYYDGNGRKLSVNVPKVLASE